MALKKIMCVLKIRNFPQSTLSDTLRTNPCCAAGSTGALPLSPDVMELGGSTGFGSVAPIANFIVCPLVGVPYASLVIPRRPGALFGFFTLFVWASGSAGEAILCPKTGQ